MSKNLLVALADKNCIDQAKQLFSSVYFNAGWKGDYMLMSYDIPENELNWFRNKGILIYKCKPIHNGKESGIEYPPLDSELPEEKKISIDRMRKQPIMLNKFEMFTPYFKKWDTVLYLDCDIIVRYSLDELTKVKGFCAVKDHPYFYHIRSQFIKNKMNDSIYQNLKKEFNLNDCAFNAGVMAFSTNVIKENTFEKLLELFQKYHTISAYGDQPIFNLFFNRRWKKLHYFYNFSPIWSNHFKISIVKNNAIIIHTLGPEKVWLPENPLYDEWRNNLSKAEKIDLNHRRLNSDMQNKMKIKTFDQGNFIDTINIHVKLRTFYEIYDKNIGKIGIFLRKKYPKIYFFLKKKKHT